MTLVWSINGTDIASQNIYTGGTFDSWLSAPSITRNTTPIPNRVGSILSATSQASPRQFVLPIFLNTFTLSDRTTAADWIKQWLDQTITLRGADGVTTRELIGVVTGVSLTPQVTANNTSCRGALTLLCADPLWRATTDTTTGSIQSTPVAISLGSGPTEDWSLSITVSGGSDPRTITVTIGGTVSYTMTWTAGTFGGHALVADAGACSVLVNGVSQVAKWAGGFPPLSPRNGSVTLAIASSSGTATGVLTHRKRYQ